MDRLVEWLLAHMRARAFPRLAELAWAHAA